MDWKRYKQICDRPDVFSRWMLRQTAELLEPTERRPLELALERVPLEKPSDHRGDADTDMFELALGIAELSRINAVVREAVERGEDTSGTRARGLGGFGEAWSEYFDWMAGPDRASPEARS